MGTVGAFKAQLARNLKPIPEMSGLGKFRPTPANIISLGASIHTAKHSMEEAGSGGGVNRLKIQTETLPKRGGGHNRVFC